MKDVIYGISSDGQIKKEGYKLISLPNGKIIQVKIDDIEKEVPVSPNKDGLIAYYMKSDSVITIDLNIGDADFASIANDPIRSFPKYYDDDGGSPLKSYDDPMANANTFPKFYDDDGGTPFKSRDDGWYQPHSGQSQDLALARSGARKRIEDTAFWPSW